MQPVVKKMLTPYTVLKPDMCYRVIEPIHMLRRLLLAWVLEPVEEALIGDDALLSEYTYSPSTYCAPVLYVVRFLRRAYFCSRR